MSKLILAGIAIAIIAVIVSTCQKAAPAMSDPVTTAISDDLKFAKEAEMTVRVTNQINAIKGLLILGSVDALSAKSVTDGNRDLHTDMNDAERRLATLGDAQTRIEHWKKTIHWDEFLRNEDELTRALAKSAE